MINKTYYLIIIHKSNHWKRGVGRLFSNVQNIATVPFVAPSSDSTENEENDGEINAKESFKPKSNVILATSELSYIDDHVKL